LFSAGLEGDNYLGFGEGNPHSPLMFHYFTGQNVEMWENQAGMQLLYENLLKKNQESTEFMSAVIAEQRKILKEIEPYWQKDALSEPESKAYLDLIYRGITNVTLYFFSGMNEQTPEEIKKMVVDIRTEDEFFANNDKFIRKIIAGRGYPEQFADIILPSEFAALPSKEVLEGRSKHALLVGGKELIAISLTSYAQSHPEFEFKGMERAAMEATEVRGQIAYKGRVQGVVHIVRNRLQMETVKEGEILVSPMTTPDFLPAMKIAAAFVTDEGGIVCHAAIVAREMKKPCIIGTKIATQVLKDGDLVEVDAEKGVVVILERKG
jgi:phosphohistidine swiveling domain-containing protein